MSIRGSSECFVHLAQLELGCARRPLKGHSIYLPTPSGRRHPAVRLGSAGVAFLLLPPVMIVSAGTAVLRTAVGLVVGATLGVSAMGRLAVAIANRRPPKQHRKSEHCDSAVVAGQRLKGLLSDEAVRRGMRRAGAGMAVVAFAVTMGAVARPNSATLADRPDPVATLIAGSVAVPSPTVALPDRFAQTPSPSPPLPRRKAAAPATPVAERRPAADPVEEAVAVRQRSADPRPTAAFRPRLAAPLAMGYAASSADAAAPFELLLGAEAAATVPPVVQSLGLQHWWSDRPLPKSSTGQRATTCLAEAIYFEARGETLRGQAAVAQVVVNRVKNPAYPYDLCDVVYQNKSWFNRCQFTFACDRTKDVVLDPAAWDRAIAIARAYASGATWLPEVGAATHYHTTDVAPAWAAGMRAVNTIDRHVFYMTLGGGLG